jgi:hypothetical protein
VQDARRVPDQFGVGLEEIKQWMADADIALTMRPERADAWPSAKGFFATMGGFYFETGSIFGMAASRNAISR